MRSDLSVTTCAAMLALALCVPGPADAAPAAKLERGRYVVTLGGCNDCHTEGFGPSNGKVPQSQWLTGSSLGSRGGWGTTYPVNLRMYMQGISEDEWVKRARTIETRPPMPWFVLHEIEEADLRAMHAFVRSLGPVGTPAPAYLPPGQEPPGPVILFPGPPPMAKP